jgi:two-component system, LuxR family, response regulator FixJ
MSLIYIVDDDDAMRDSLSLLLESAGFTTETFELAFSALKRCRQKKPNCVVTDVRMPGMDGLEFYEKLIYEGIDVPVIVMTGHGDVPLAVRAMKSGATDFIEKPFDDDAMIASITRAVECRSTPKSQFNNELRIRYQNLTPREREIIGPLASGAPNKAIAIQLKISPRTVEVHRARIMSKMRASNLAELVRMAIELDVLSSSQL